LSLQQRAEAQLATLTDQQAGAIVVLDPTNGAVLASASGPSFDPNIFADLNVSKLYNEYLENERAPLYNRVTRGLYPPGSTVKPLVGMMALDSGRFMVSTEFTGTIYQRQWLPTLSGWVYPAITRATDYPKPYNMTNALVHSDNIYFGNAALTCGWDNIVNMYKDISFDRSINYDIPVSQPSIYTDTSRSNLRLLADMGYGQGELLVTPLQMASIYTLFLNNGDILQPYIVSAFMQEDDTGDYVQVESFGKTVYADTAFTQDALAQIEPILESVIKNNYQIKVSGIRIAGKTGTAELDGDSKREIAWLIAYVVDAGYERLVCVALEVEANAGTIRYDMVEELLRP